jgi:hypothetical protein
MCAMSEERTLVRISLLVGELVRDGRRRREKEAAEHVDDALAKL